MIIPGNQNTLDTRGLDDLKRAARDAPDKALKTAATQFEALFMNMILKNMRDATPKDSLLASSAGDTYTGMLDQQLSQKLAGKGTGLADMLVKQLSRNIKPALAPNAEANNNSAVGKMSAMPAPASASGIRAAPLTPRPTTMLHSVVPATTTLQRTPASAIPLAATPATSKISTINNIEKKREFVGRVAEHAKAAEQQTGVPAKFMIGQAALESGWGKHEIKDLKGQPAFNLFGIKATGGWRGATVDVTTTEFVGGVAKKVIEKFRAYSSYAEGFADYAKMLANSPRYATVLKTAQQGAEFFAQGLQRAGYATDPAYAEKLSRVISETTRIDRQA